MKKHICSLLCIFLLLSAVNIFTPGAAAEESTCRDITKSCTVTLNGARIDYDLTDRREDSFLQYSSAEIVINAPEAVGGIYIEFDYKPPVWTLSYEGENKSCGKYSFIHEYQSVDKENVTSLTLSFKSKVSFSEIYVLSRGEKLPDYVQTWRPAEGQCDIMLLSCHSDDDQLFFAGSVPDAVARGAEMQVCYFNNHWNTHRRQHELLNGLWTCGLDRYPVIGRFPDIKREDSEKEMLDVYAQYGYTYEQMVTDQVELLRKYKPQIVLAHDVYGEYGHGSHRLDCHSLRDAAEVSNDASKYTESAKKYGVWNVPKIYIHLYYANQIDFEIDVPLEYFGGKTAYQVSQQAFLCHVSQYDTVFRRWMFGEDEEHPFTDSHDFAEYGPCCYGLWRSTVGPDVIKADFYENITLLSGKTPEHYTAQETTAPPETSPPETTPPETTTEETTTEETTTEETTTEETTTEETTTEEQTVTETETETTEITETETETDEPAETAAETVTAAETSEPATDTEKTPDGSETTAESTKEPETDVIPEPKNKVNPLPIIICSVCALAVAAIFILIKKKLKK